eukprot:PhM_4_TR3592/c0_g1_i1/m.45028/K13421/UMPS; uridine monophosphate synthetase
MAAKLPPVALTDAPLHFSERAKLTDNAMTRRLFETMERKQSNLSFNPDLTDADEVLRLADVVGPHICMMKTHCDILTNFTKEFVAALKQLSEKHDFVIFEDRKFSDIGAVVKGQYAHGPYAIAEWADVVTCHGVAGPGCLAGLAEVGVPLQRGCLLVAEMSTAGSLCVGSYTDACIDMAKDYKQMVVGFVCQRRLTADQGFLHLTPGIKLQQGGDGLGQQFNTPHHAIAVQGSDIIQVGRGIAQAEDPLAAAAEYRLAAWSAYLERFASKTN